LNKNEPSSMQSQKPISYVSSIWNFDWGEDGSFVISPAESGLILLSKPGADPEILTTLKPTTNETSHKRINLKSVY